MSRVVILGAGELGGALAYTLLRRDCAREIRLIDPAADVAAGKALDIRQSGPIVGSDVAVTAAADVNHVVNASVVVLADPAKAGDDAAARIALLERIAPLMPPVALICAGPADAQVIAQAAARNLAPRLRLLGSAPEAFAAAVRALVALEIDASPDDVALGVAGLPPRGLVVGWSEATVGGAALSRVLPAPALQRLAARVDRLWPPGPAALASAAARVIESILAGSRRQATCFVALDGELGQRTGVSALPVRLGPRGVARVGRPALSAHERTKLENVLAGG